MPQFAVDDNPDFQAIYAGVPISIRDIAKLWVTATLLTDNFRARTSWDGLREELPRIAQPVATDEWLCRFVARFEVVTQRLATSGISPDDIAACTADEMILHIVINAAVDFDADGIINASWIDALPASEHDGDFEWCREILLADDDVLLLFEPSLDGIEDPESEEHDLLRPANLRPVDWFKPFR